MLEKVITVPLPSAAEKMSDDDKKTVAYQLRCPRSWLDRIEVAAKQLQLSVASYIRMVVTQRMDADNVPKTPPKKAK